MNVPAETSAAVQLVDHVEMLAMLRLVLQNQMEILAALKGVTTAEVGQGFEATFQRCHAEAVQNMEHKLALIAQERARAAEAQGGDGAHASAN